MVLKTFMLKSLFSPLKVGSSFKRNHLFFKFRSGSDWRACDLNRTLEFQSRMDFSSFIFQRRKRRPREIQCLPAYLTAPTLC